MAFLDSLNISGSALKAGRLRMDIIAENLANAQTTRTEEGGPYRRKLAVYRSTGDTSFGRLLKNRQSSRTPGVAVEAITEDQTDFTPVFDPSHPDAGEDGYVLMPNVDEIKETVDMMAASHAYDANLNAFNAIKSMAMKALEMKV